MNVNYRIVKMSFLWTTLACSLLNAARVPSDLKPTIGFLFAENDKGEKVPNGSCFFVGISNDQEKGKGWAYLVTAEHVLKGPNGKYFKRIWLRLNTSNGGNAEFLDIPLSDPKRKVVFTHPIEVDVDIAVIPVLLPPDKLDATALPLSMLTTKEDFKSLQVGEGTDVFFAGLFTSFYGHLRNLPIFRFGRVALVSEEKIPIQENGRKLMLDLYLIEAQSFGGNSGSPVFFYFGSDRNPGSLVVGEPDIRIAGVMKGTYEQSRPLQIIQNAAIPVSSHNLGIAIVVPAFLVRDILLGPELTSEREKVAKK